MSLFSLRFICFFAIVFIFYYVISPKYQYIWLLAASWFFYGSWSKKCLLVLLLFTAITYWTAILMQKKNKDICLWCGIICSIGLLCLFKFWKIWAEGLRYFLHIADTNTGGIINILVPVGLSFFVLQVVGYLIDVYRGKTTAERNFAKYALFVSFFPSILSGPIERTHNLLEQIRKGTHFSYETVKSGLCLMVWGYVMKLLIANRLAMIVDAAFADYAAQTGATLLIAVILYGIQLYADFAGYSCIAIGLSKTLGFHLIENFRQPYFSRSIREFWGRWHISLSSWLKDYVYIPLGGNRCSKLRGYLNLLLTFLVSGLWHGTGWQYMAWGGLHGLYQIVSKITFAIRSKVTTKLKIKTEHFGYHLWQSVITFILVDFAWLFFRASSLKEALSILHSIVFNLQIGDTIINRLYLVGYDIKRFWLLLVEIAILFAVDCIHEKRISIIGWLNARNRVFRWGVYVFVCMALIVGIIHDFGLDASTFIYTQF